MDEYILKNFMSLKNKREFDSVYQQRVSFANKYLVMYKKNNDSEQNRIGISVSKKVGNSVVRHKLTRLIRECYRLHKDEIQTGLDIVIVARVNASSCNYWEIESAFLHLARLHHIMNKD